MRKVILILASLVVLSSFAFAGGEQEAGKDVKTLKVASVLPPSIRQCRLLPILRSWLRKEQTEKSRWNCTVTANLED